MIERAAARVALYYAPETDDPLWRAGSCWLGRECATGAPMPQPAIPDLPELTAEPRLYGFHATLKPPMRLREGAAWADVMDAAHGIAAAVAPFDLPSLAVADLHGFLALRETTPCTQLQAFADLCVAALDHLRAPSTEAELARRRRADLSPAQQAMLVRWGYPWMFGTWFFHMTLTRRLDEGERARIRPVAERYFREALAAPCRVSSLCLFTQRAPGQNFVIAERLPLRG